MRFINREQELARLDREYASDRFSFVIIYGRRRLGKTRLIQEFVRDKNALYFLADTQADLLNRRRLQHLAAEQLGDDHLAGIEFPDWDATLRYIVQKFEARGRKFVLAIDEFQYLVQAEPATPSSWQRFIDTFLAQTNCMLIFCGSIVSLMHKHTLSYSSPLYGRRTAQIKLNALDFRNFQAFFPDVPRIAQVELYGLLSGVPKYIELFEYQQNVLASIRDNFLAPSSFFYQEPRFLLHEEFSTGATYFSILRTMAGGEHKLGKIAAKIGLPGNSITSFMNKLRDLEIVQREVPVFEQNPEKSKKGLYFFKDHFLNFWFTFIFPNMSYLEMGNTDFVMHRIERSFHEYCSLIYEKVCREHLAANPPFPMSAIGRHWDRRMEIDIVVTGEQDVLLAECKWSNSKVGMNVLRDLQAKASLLDAGLLAGRSVQYALFSKSGFTPDMVRTAQEQNIALFA